MNIHVELKFGQLQCSPWTSSVQGRHSPSECLGMAIAVLHVCKTTSGSCAPPESKRHSDLPRAGMLKAQMWSPPSRIATEIEAAHPGPTLMSLANLAGFKSQGNKDEVDLGPTTIRKSLVCREFAETDVDLPRPPWSTPGPAGGSSSRH